MSLLAVYVGSFLGSLVAIAGLGRILLWPRRHPGAVPPAGPAPADRARTRVPRPRSRARFRDARPPLV